MPKKYLQTTSDIITHEPRYFSLLEANTKKSHPYRKNINPVLA